MFLQKFGQLGKKIKTCKSARILRGIFRGIVKIMALNYSFETNDYGSFVASVGVTTNKSGSVRSNPPEQV
jgi:hypothetical protein